MKFQILAALFAVASGISIDHVLHERRDALPKHWTKRSKLESDVQLPMRIGMKQSNVEHAEDLMMEISDPDSPRFGQHLTEDEVIDLFAPSKEAVDAITEWLHSAGISRERISQSFNKQWIQFDAAVEEAERLFKTKYHAWEHVPSGNFHPACDEYHLPHHIKHHVDYITPGLKLFSPSKRSSNKVQSKRAELAERAEISFPGPILGPVVSIDQGLTDAQLLKLCNDLISPPCIAKLYNITKGTKAHPSNRMGIFEEGDYYAAEDLVEFFALLAPNINPLTKPILHGIDGGRAPGLVATGESDLDFQVAYPIIHPQQAVLFQTDDKYYAKHARGFFNTFLDAIDGSYCSFKAYGEKGNADRDPKYPDPHVGGYKGKLMCGTYKPTNVISVSYGLQENQLPLNYQRRQCLEFMKLGMRGVSILIASGDSGVAARSADDGNKNGCLGKNGTVFNPDSPASCPWVTAVGATQLISNKDVARDGEVATSSFPSGGGFSNMYPTPKYQRAKVQTYLTDHSPGYKSYVVNKATNDPSEKVTKGGRFNRAGRGYPDVSAIGNNIAIVLDGAPNLVLGTSASTPIVGAMVNRANEERLSQGKRPIGFLNTVFYKHPGIFHDITSGNNAGCGTDGFTCAEGWDPLTGLGTPNYPHLVKVFTSLP